jgi:hypoxanthine phosphoribosyltransferase
VKTILSEAEIHTGVLNLAQQLSARYGDTPLTIVGVLTGSLVFMADLIRQLHMPLRVGLVQASSYRGAVTEHGELAVNASWLPPVEGRHVLLIDDIFDTGHTLAAMLGELTARRPASLASAVLLTKQGRSEVPQRPDYSIFDIPDVFVVGYGLDYNDHYRNLPYVAEMESADLEQ